MSTVVLVPGDMVLLKSDACVGKRKINDWWNEKPYTVICQIVPDALVYEIKDDSGKTQIIHCNRLLFTALEWGNVSLCPARGDETLDQTWSVLAESTPEGVMKELNRICTHDEGQAQASLHIAPLGLKLGSYNYSPGCCLRHWKMVDRAYPKGGRPEITTHCQGLNKDLIHGRMRFPRLLC